MYQYTSNSMSSFQSLPDTYYPSSQHQPHHHQQGYEWYPQQQQQVSMAPTATSTLAHPSYSSLSMTSPPGTTSSASTSNTTTTNTNTPPSPPHLNNHHHHRPKITTSLWEDEGTICYQVDARGICVARRQDNDMINGTKLLNVTGMSRGKRDGILKNEKGRVVVKVGAMHLKGVWVTFSRAKALAIQHNIKDVLEPLFVDDPSIYFYSNPMAPPHANYFIPTNQQQQTQAYVASSVPPPPPMEEMVYSAHRHTQPSMESRPVVPSMGNNPHLDYYAYRNNSNMSNISSTSNPPSLLASHSVDQLDQHSLLDYASKASSSMFSLPSPGTPSQQSLFYNDTALDQYYQPQQKPSRPPVNDQMLDLPMAPTLPSSSLDPKPFYYTHPCASTASFHDQPTTFPTKFEQDHQATLDFYGSYTPSQHHQQQQQQYSAQQW